jgi:membrane-bound lytic murein transglycosylase D
VRSLFFVYGILLFLALSPEASNAQTPPTEVAKESPDLNEVEEKELETPEPARLEMPGQTVQWKAPDFTKQENVLGWSAHAFDTPPGFDTRKDFWIDIYTKYSTHQAVIHDSHYLDIIYKIVDFSLIDSDKTLTSHAKEKQKRNLIKNEKRKIHDELLNISHLEETPGRLSADEAEIFKKFRYVYDKKRFMQAADRHRLRMQLGQKDRFQQGIFYSGRYIREMESIFRKEGVPVELTRLPFVESSFNINARSRVGASGIWQFMRSTAKLYLKSTPIVDFRNDPIQASRAAAKLLRSNFTLLKSWPLALTAYNHGPQGVSLIVKKMKTGDLNEIVWNTTRRRFGFASENFYAEFLAALEVESHCDQYFGKILVSAPLSYTERNLPSDIKFSELQKSLAFNLDVYDPFFTKEVLEDRKKIPSGFMIRIPKE